MKPPQVSPHAVPRAFGAALIAIVLAAAGAAGPVSAQAPKRPAKTVAAAPAPVYFPGRFDWQKRSPSEAGMDAARIDEAVRFAVANETPGSKDLTVELATTFGAREPFDTPIGPVQTRGSANGLIVRGGYVVAEWGDTSRVDMTFSVTKTFLSTVVGLAWQRGLIRDVTDLAGDYMPGQGYFDGHNAAITWEHLLRQTSDWQGTLWGKPDWADRPEGATPAEWPNRKLHEPGTHYKYNDTRVNLLALLTLQVWRRPLPAVLRDEVMEPIGASTTWRWHGYENSWVEIDGQRIQSMTGGGHWGGGMFINARDMARFGYLFLRDGSWKDRQIVSPAWIAMARTGGPANPEYGFMNWFLNPGRKSLPATPESSVTFRGNGQNIIYVDWENDLVVVTRWIRSGPALNDFLGKVLAAIAPRQAALPLRGRGFRG
jgi:CubicO group peptidase (beta-lactamase class C family)